MITYDQHVKCHVTCYNFKWIDFFQCQKKVVKFKMYENYIKWLNYKLQELIIAERMRSIGEVNVENQVPYRCHIICHMNRFMVKGVYFLPQYILDLHRRNKTNRNCWDKQNKENFKFHSCLVPLGQRRAQQRRNRKNWAFNRTEGANWKPAVATKCLEPATQEQDRSHLLRRNGTKKEKFKIP